MANLSRSRPASLPAETKAMTSFRGLLVSNPHSSPPSTSTYHTGVCQTSLRNVQTAIISHLIVSYLILHIADLERHGRGNPMRDFSFLKLLISSMVERSSVANGTWSDIVLARIPGRESLETSMTWDAG